MINRMLETGDLARAAIQMWMKDPTAKLVFDKPKDGKIWVQISAFIPQREVDSSVESMKEEEETMSEGCSEKKVIIIEDLDMCPVFESCKNKPLFGVWKLCLTGYHKGCPSLSSNQSIIKEEHE